MSLRSHTNSPVAVIIAGIAGSGKSTLGRSLAQHLSAPFLDLDSITNPLLDALFNASNANGAHWLALDQTLAIREARYAALRAVVHDQINVSGQAVIVAPFTAEMQGGLAWQKLLQAIQPARVAVFYITGDASVFQSRRAERGAERDLHQSDSGVVQEPRIPHHSIDAELSPLQQVHRVLMHLGNPKPIDSKNTVFTRSFDAVLFDLDGTLIDSTASVNRSWRRLADHYGISVEKLFENHGKPAKSLIEILLPRESQEEGLRRITSLEVSDALGLETIPGGGDFFHSVPTHLRAVVTSGSIHVATARLNAVGIDIPEVMVTGDDVREGKPQPEPFLVAAQRLGVDPMRCLVFEDSPAGITSAKVAGCTVVAVRGTVDERELAMAHLIVDNFKQVTLSSWPDNAMKLTLAH